MKSAFETIKTKFDNILTVNGVDIEKAYL